MPTNRPSIPAETARAIFVEAGHRCACCGVAFPLERAHIVPWRQSRDHDAKNLLCLCANCHEMADRDWDMQTFFAYKRRPWVNRQGQGEGPSQQATDSPSSSAQSGPSDHVATCPAEFPSPRLVNSGKEAMLLCFAHLTVEQERWGLDETDADSWRYLCEMESVTWEDFSGQKITRDITATEKADWLRDYRARIAAHLQVGVSRPNLGRRMDRIYSHFSVFGYNQHYAGFEAFLRDRFYHLLRIDEFVRPPNGEKGWRKRFDEVEAALWENPKVQIEAAVYMAYTDYMEAKIRQLWDVESAPDTAAPADQQAKCYPP